MSSYNISKTSRCNARHNIYFTLFHKGDWIQLHLGHTGSMHIKIRPFASGTDYSSLNKYQNGRSYIRRVWPLSFAAVLTVFGAAQWHRFKKKSEDGTLKEAKDWEVTCYCSVPLRIMSRSWGWISNRELPVKLRPAIYSAYASVFKVNLQEASSDDLTSYPTLADFFCRPLRDGARPIDFSDCVVSPADGHVLSLGKISSARVEQVKGVTYSLRFFLGPHTWDSKDCRLKTEEHATADDSQTCASSHKDSCVASLLKNKDNALYHCVIYLAPGDYHRFHSSVEWTINFRRHIQGELLSVNPTIAQWIPNLFVLNERVIYVGEWKHGFFAYAAVGATNVGSIHVYCDEALKTNEWKWQNKNKYRDRFLSDSVSGKLKMTKGEPFGEFRLGSTVVVLFEAPQNFKFRVKPGDKVIVGEALSYCMS